MAIYPGSHHRDSLYFRDSFPLEIFHEIHLIEIHILNFKFQKVPKFVPF